MGKPSSNRPAISTSELSSSSVHFTDSRLSFRLHGSGWSGNRGACTKACTGVDAAGADAPSNANSLVSGVEKAIQEAISMTERTRRGFMALSGDGVETYAQQVGIFRDFVRKESECPTGILESSSTLVNTVGDPHRFRHRSGCRATGGPPVSLCLVGTVVSTWADP